MKPLALATAAAVLLGSAPLDAQTVAPGYEVGTWQGFRAAAVSHTFDDNDPNQLAVAVPMFDEFGFKLTLFAVTGTNWRPIDWDGLAAAAAGGHEVTAHTVSHPDLSTLPVEEQRAQLEGARDAIRANVPGAEVLTLAYPFCVVGDRGLVEELFIAARVCSGQVDQPTPADLYVTSSMIVGPEGGRTTAAHLNADADAAASRGGWVTYLTHGIDNDGGWSSIASAELRAHVEYLSENAGRFWVATYADVARYIRERDAASVTEVSAGDGEIVVEVTDSLDDAIYTVPITVRRALPEGWASAVVTQDGERVSAEIVAVEGASHVQFDVVPDGGEVVLTRSEGTSTSENAGPRGATFLVGPQPNPFQSTTTLVYEVGQSGRVTVEVYDVLGRRLETLVDRVQAPGRHTVAWDASGYEPGTYTYRLGAGDHVDAGQVILTR